MKGIISKEINESVNVSNVLKTNFSLYEKSEDSFNHEYHGILRKNINNVAKVDISQLCDSLKRLDKQRKKANRHYKLDIINKEAIEFLINNFTKVIMFNQTRYGDIVTPADFAIRIKQLENKEIVRYIKDKNKTKDIDYIPYNLAAYVLKLAEEKGIVEKVCVRHLRNDSYVTDVFYKLSNGD